MPGPGLFKYFQVLTSLNLYDILIQCSNHILSDRFIFCISRKVLMHDCYWINTLTWLLVYLQSCFVHDGQRNKWRCFVSINWKVSASFAALKHLLPPNKEERKEGINDVYLTSMWSEYDQILCCQLFYSVLSMNLIWQWYRISIVLSLINLLFPFVICDPVRQIITFRLTLHVPKSRGWINLVFLYMIDYWSILNF